MLSFNKIKLICWNKYDWRLECKNTGVVVGTDPRSCIFAQLIAKQIAAKHILRVNSDNASRRSSIRRCHIRQHRTRCKQHLSKTKTLSYAPFGFSENNTTRVPLSPRFCNNFHSKKWISRFCISFSLKNVNFLFCWSVWNLVSSFHRILIGLDCAERRAVYFDLWCNCASIAHGSGRGWGG